MLRTLSLRGYRGFESYEVGGLARVNLVVGRNNSGKTSVLEAVELLASGGNPATILESSKRRGEVRPATQFARFPNVTHLFHGHPNEPGAFLELSSNCHDTVRVELLSWDEADPEGLKWRALAQREANEPEPVAPALALRIAASETLLPVGEDGALLQARTWRPPGNVRFLTLGTLDAPFVAQTWNAILSEGREAEIVRDMRMLLPEIESIHFLAGGRFSGGGIVVGLKNGGPRQPIGSFGDGIRRLLLLRLSLAGHERGCVLVDEIDAGLHWTVMAEMWELVVRVAVASDMQVFATTHNADCIRGLASMIRSHSDLAEEVAIQKVDASLPRAVALPGDRIPVADEHGIEVR